MSKKKKDYTLSIEEQKLYEEIKEMVYKEIKRITGGVTLGEHMTQLKEELDEYYK